MAILDVSMHKFRNYLFLLILVGCLGIRQNRSKDLQIPVTITVKRHDPYCGGAPPPREMEGGFASILPNQNFYIKKGVINDQNNPVLAEVSTDSSGRFNTELDTGLYMLIFPEKHSSFEDFYQSQSKESRMLQAGPKDCFRAWWQRPDATLHITETTSHIECIIRATCDAGFNPCMVYTGPRRP